MATILGGMACILGAAGASKIRSAFVRRTPLAMALGRKPAGGLGLAELLISGMLTIPATARVGVLMATVLFAVFAAGIALSRRQGRVGDCGCGTTLLPTTGFTRAHERTNLGIAVMGATALISLQALDIRSSATAALIGTSLAASLLLLVLSVAALRRGFSLEHRTFKNI